MRREGCSKQNSKTKAKGRIHKRQRAGCSQGITLVMIVAPMMNVLRLLLDFFLFVFVLWERHHTQASSGSTLAHVRHFIQIPCF